MYYNVVISNNLLAAFPAPDLLISSSVTIEPRLYNSTVLGVADRNLARSRDYVSSWLVAL